MSYVIECQGLSKRFGNLYANQDIDLRVKSGEICGLIGKNGSGKSTLIHQLAGLIQPSSGTFSLLGAQSPQNLIQARRHFGFQLTLQMRTDLSAKENLLYYSKVLGRGTEYEIDQLLNDFHLTEAGNKKYKTFSTGMKQKLSLCLALLGQPDVLVLDEPINGLDPFYIKYLRELLLDRSQRYGTSCLISSHILSELDLLCDHFAIIHQGRILKHLHKNELKQFTQKNLLIEISAPERSIAILETELHLLPKLTADRKILIENPSLSLEEISKTLARYDLWATSIQSVNSSLEDYYFQLVGSEN